MVLAVVLLAFLLLLKAVGCNQEGSRQNHQQDHPNVLIHKKEHNNRKTKHKQTQYKDV